MHAADPSLAAPAAAPQAAGVQADAGQVAPTPATPWTVLCVDDEPSILTALRRALRSPTRRVLSANSGAEALTLLAREPVDLVISDMRMPGMDGAQLLEQVQQRWPQVVRVLLTGHADMQATVAAINRGQIYRYLHKPWDDLELGQTVDQGLERLRLERETERLQRLTTQQNQALCSLNATLEQRVEERTGELRQTHERLKRNFMSSIKVFSSLIELRGGQQVGHGRRVAEKARLLAKAAGCTGTQQQEIFVAALLHDLGHIGLPDALLTKPLGKLNADELARHRQHTVQGEQALLGLEGQQAVAALIRSHHERFDGRGYPDGLAGDAIPLGARILQIADTFDDLQTGQLGSGTLSAANARVLMQRGRGTQFDPELLDVFLHITEPSRPKPAAPVTMGSHQLVPGMTLAGELLAPDGALLLAADHVLTADLIRRIRSHEERQNFCLLLQIKPSGGG